MAVYLGYNLSERWAMNQLFETQRIILEQFETSVFYNRLIFNDINLNFSLVGIVGPRGIGKTTLLLRHVLLNGARNRKALYVSADSLYFLDHRLIELVDELYKETDIRLLCIDEIQKYPSWNQELKNIADTYKDFRIVFSGSSMIDIVHSKYDLSRRVILYPLCGFSFREYLEFYLNITLPTFTFQDIVQNHAVLAEQLSIQGILKHFKEYLRVGYYPFFAEFDQEREKFQAIENAVQKTIYEDIANLKSLKTPTLMIIEKLYKYVVNSAVGELSVYKLASTLQKDFESVSEYLRLLNLSGLIRTLYPKQSGKAQLRNPAKMYPDNPNLIYAAYLPQSEDSTQGKVRETFVINQLQNAHFTAYSTEVGDFRIDDYYLEIGGKNKTLQQVKNQTQGIVFADGIVTGTGKIIPLYLLGFLY